MSLINLKPTQFLLTALCVGCLLVPAYGQSDIELNIEHYNFENGISDQAPNAGSLNSDDLNSDDFQARYDNTALNNVPYEKEFLRLSEILGAMHFLNTICPANVKKNWRGTMGTLLNTERASAQYRSKITSYFNRGFQTYQMSYKTCTPNAKYAIEQYMAEGANLTQAIVVRYGRQ